MKEDLLHFIWKYKKYPINGLISTMGEAVRVLATGTHNHLSGPDFFNAQVELNGQLWAGNVEIHIKSSDWYAHKHQEDANYDNVILHVVWEDDVSVFRKDGSEIATLSLQKYIPLSMLETYQQLFDSKNYKFINCEREFIGVDQFTKNNWLDRLFVERLEQKSIFVIHLLEHTKNDWEQVLFLMLLKTFGSKINGEIFVEIGKSINFSIIRKLYKKQLELSSLLFGQANLLKGIHEEDHYYKDLLREYTFLKHKFTLVSVFKSPEFFRLRPPNFPTIRLAQLSAIYAENNNLFHALIENETPNFSEILNVETADYWDTHFNFGKISKKSKKRLTDSFLNLLLINTIIPLKFTYQRYKGNVDYEALFKMMSIVKKEENSIIGNFEKLGAPIDNAKDSQTYLQLYNNYCKKDKCLDCAVGASLMNLKV
ncbi:uncharacterized protein DUF2851 [Maribacter spongiicola]|uniref:Uncharacterized protein DUF2851 n=1 Tax=Maribacter spongiicola TaxID=1206753 RepID=A0A4R7JPP7_9FLAO|nr:DUF2851 family protein [Maribacter spongiicola]TDT39606.1 uncharacterized protein DUF2851 [Maribacter spongiicola]